LKKYFIPLAFFILTNTFSQIIGIVTDVQKNTLPSTNVFVENTYNNTTTNEKGKYELNLKKPGNYTIVFQMLGFKTQRVSVEIKNFPFELNTVLVEENYTLAEVVISTKEDPANQVIRNAIAARKENSFKHTKYTADFYSKGLFRIKDAPKKILGQDLGDFEGALDSTRTGILYLSETVSKLQFQKPDKMKETIIASKVSGKDNGFSFNNAADVDFDFYENNLPFQINVISPIGDNAFSYYKFKMEGSFFTNDKQQINKIKVIPRRDVEPVVEGYIYIVEDSWAIYAVDVTLKGYRMQTPMIDYLKLSQNYSYNPTDKNWTKSSQSMDFMAGMMGVNVSGKFTYVYSNYEFEPIFDKKTFTREILSFKDGANKKDETFWNTIRPIPLTIEESSDYVKKDSIQTLIKSKKYLDSIDVKSNKFSFIQILTGHRHKNSYQGYEYGNNGFLQNLEFNTVQGYVLQTDFFYKKQNKDTRTFTNINVNFNYGLSEKKSRGNANFTKKLNNQTHAFLDFSGGSKAAQINQENPISPLINSVSTLFFKDNYLKLFEKNWLKIGYSQEVFNGLYVTTKLEYSERKPLCNTTSQSYTKTSDIYTSNNPLLPYNYSSTVINKSNLVKATISGKINFKQEYWSRPDGKFNLPNNKFPVVYVTFEKGLLGNLNRYNYEFIDVKVTKDFSLGNKGNLGVNIESGKFFNAKNISFVDYKHFLGNQTHIGKTDNYLNNYNLLPYYSHSTNNAFLELHAEYDDKGFLINKIPLLNLLKTNLIMGYHNLSIPEAKPYHEFSVGLDNLGFGKFKVFRLDYVRSYQNGFQTDGVIFGLKILNIVD